MRQHTAHTVREIIQSGWESDLPDKVLTALRPLEGKQVTTRLLDKLPGGKDVWRLRREYGMTHLENVAYRQGNYKDGIGLLFYHGEDSRPLNCAEIVERNPAYFSARIARNHHRMELLNNLEQLTALAVAMNRAEVAIDALHTAQAELSKLTEYGEMAHPDQYSLERACGLDDIDGRPIVNREYKGRAPELAEA